MHPDRIAELLDPFLGHSPENTVPDSQEPSHSRAASAIEKFDALSAAQLQNISIYIDLLLRWNSRVNLTSVRQPEEIVTRHFGESLFVARHLFPIPVRVAPGLRPGDDEFGLTEPGPPEQTLSKHHTIDVGSGAGFPGLPIRIWATHIHLTLIESNHKKATFLREVVRALTFTNVDVFTGRAERFQESAQAKNKREGFINVVTLRAVEHFESILPAAAGLVGPSGRLAILIGQAQLNRAQQLVPHLQWDTPARLPLSSSRFLIIGRNESRQLHILQVE